MRISGLPRGIAILALLAPSAVLAQSLAISTQQGLSFGRFAAGAGAQSLAISTQQGLSFGRFAAGAGGTVAVSAAGIRTATGSVVLLSSNGGHEARYLLTGGSDLTYAITLPADNTVTLSDGSGREMTVTRFTSSPEAAGQLSPAGTQVLTLGATLNVAPAQPAASYSGAFTLTVNYN